MLEGILVISQALKVDLVSWSKPILHLPIEMEEKTVDNTNRDHTRNIQYKQGLYKIITEDHVIKVLT